jgi:putative addiction module CopG family antidote
MPVKSVDIPAGLEETMKREVDRGHYQSESELMRDAIRRLMEDRHKVDEALAAAVKTSIECARGQEDAGDVTDLIEDHL